MLHIYLVRHGTTIGLEAGKAQGSMESPLSPTGKREAQQTAQALQPIKFDAVFCSPMGRTRETAQIICAANKCEAIMIDELREMDFGWLEGRPYFSAPGENAGLLEKLGILIKVVIAQLTGERLAHLQKRALIGWQKILNACPEGTILIVSHGVIFNYLISLLISKDQFDAIKPIHLEPCSISEILYKGIGEAEILHLNGTEHLKI